MTKWYVCSEMKVKIQDKIFLSNCLVGSECHIFGDGIWKKTYSDVTRVQLILLRNNHH